MKIFPSISNWNPHNGVPLTLEEKDMCMGPSAEVSKLSSFSYQDMHGRSIRFTSEESNQPQSSCRSSYVFMRSADGSVIFGEILFLFQHTFNESTTTLAYTNWFDGYTTDSQSGLVSTSVDARSDACPIRPAKTLSRPLVTAMDTQHCNTLWILNYQ